MKAHLMCIKLNIILFITLFLFLGFFKDLFPQQVLLDTNFGKGGIVNTIFNVKSQNSFESAAIDSEGRIVAVGGLNDESPFKFALIRYNPDGNLDTTFGTEGVVTTLLGNTDFTVPSVALQLNGKIIVGGSFKNGSYSNVALLRYNSDGSLDENFGSGGLAFVSTGSSSAFASSIAIQTDDKIVESGTIYSGAGSFFVTRFNSNGDIDSSFGTNGFTITSIQDFAQSPSICIQNDGKIILAGESRSSNNYNVALARYQTNGKLDNTFGVNSSGIVTTEIGGNQDFTFSVVKQNNGKIVVAGVSDVYGLFNYMIARYDSSGKLDPTFGNGGATVLRDDYSYNYLYSLAIQSDGKIIGAGSYGYGLGMVRLNSNGSLDTTFGGTGIVKNSFMSLASSITLSQNNEIIVAGDLRIKNKVSFALARFDYKGDPVNSFGTHGVVNTEIGKPTDQANSIAIQKDGKILAAGYSLDENFDTVFALVRYNENGELDNNFGLKGIANAGIKGLNDQINSVAIQGDGKIVAAGSMYSGGSVDPHNEFGLARFNSNGSIDSAFGPEGKGTLFTQIGSSDCEANSIAIQSDGKIIAAGQSYDGNNYYFTIVRYNVDGTLDNTFGENNNGYVTTLIGNSSCSINSVIIQTDPTNIKNEKILAGGFSADGLHTSFALARYNLNGDLDSTFGSNGTVNTIMEGAVINSIAIESMGGGNQKIIAAGYSRNNNIDNFTLIRYNIDGSPDTTFGSNGVVMMSIGESGSYIRSIAIQDDGKIIAAGYSYKGGYSSITSVRYNPNGDLDSTYGIIVTPIANSNSYTNSVAIKSDESGNEEIITAGYTDYGNNYKVFTLVGYKSNISITEIKQEKKTKIPSTFSLDQNYPNPFNPATMISYSIPSFGFVSLKVYDILGREVAALINENKNPGNYKVSFNAGNLASGLYIYALTAGSHTFARKMLLIK